MFIHAPNHFVLTGNWESIVCDNNGGEYKTISVKRDELLAQFNTLIYYCKCVENNKNLILVHHGI